MKITGRDRSVTVTCQRIDQIQQVIVRVKVITHSFKSHDVCVTMFQRFWHFLIDFMAKVSVKHIESKKKSLEFKGRTIARNR